ncbi:MAG: DUF2182 domain-containing protein [Burkholderiaceae bacterium]
MATLGGHTRPDGGRAPAPVLIAALAGVIGLAWAYLLAMGWGMAHMDIGIDMLIMPRMTDWGAADLALVFLMWTVMMVAMMLPTALPMVRAFWCMTRQRAATTSVLHVGVFVAGYLVIWTGFSALVTLAQWALLQAQRVTPMMELRDPLLAGLLLVGAGLFQLTPLKQACLRTCRSPLWFLMTAWRPGTRGAWLMGLRHGLWCTGCCWLLMALLFVLGVMNLAWIAALTAFVLLEKTWPAHWPGARWISPAAGLVLLVWGAALLVGALPTM